MSGKRAERGTMRVVQGAGWAGMKGRRKLLHRAADIPRLEAGGSSAGHCSGIQQHAHRKCRQIEACGLGAVIFLLKHYPFPFPLLKTRNQCL